MVKFVTCYKASGSLWFLCSNINKGKYDWPMGEIEWYSQKQLFQVQKCVSQVIRFYFTEKWQQTNTLENFIMNFVCYRHFLALLDLKQLFLRIPLNFTHGLIIFALINIGTQKSQWSACLIASYKFDQYTAF